MYRHRVGPYVVHTRQPNYRIQRWFVLVFILVLAILVCVKIFKYTEITVDNLFSFEHEKLDREMSVLAETSIVRAPQNQCSLVQTCPDEHFPFKIATGAANVIGPKICFNGQVLMGGQTKPWGHGLNIAVVNGITGQLIDADSFDMWSDDVKPLVEYLTSIKNGSLVLIASCDDPATRLNDDARTLISQLGSSQISNLSFRDNWIFVGGKGINTLKPLEKYIKNDKTVNLYGDWPEMLEMEGCIPRKQE
uniref:Zgc:101783 n=1 Tax=Astyanax mexicanus TaxID=7994 RepID=A0A3B1JTB2_ASTMX